MAVQRASNLAELIADRIGGRSYAMLEAASGGSPTKSRWHQYATGPLRSAPDFDSVPGIATALGVDVWTVWTAIGISGGLPPRVAEDSDLIMRLRGVRRHGGRGVAELTARQIDAIIEVTKAFIDPGDQLQASGTE